MPFEPDQNNRSLTPTGNKVAPHVDLSRGTEMPNGILGAKPLGGTNPPVVDRLGNPELTQPHKVIAQGTAIPERVLRGADGAWSKGR